MVLETRLEALVGFPLTEAFQEEEIAINQSSELRNAGDASGGQVVIDHVTWNLVAFKILLAIDMERNCMRGVLLSLFYFFV